MTAVYYFFSLVWNNLLWKLWKNFSLSVMVVGPPVSNIYIYPLLVCLGVCLSVRLYPINVITAELIGPKFCVDPHMAPGKIYEWSKSKKFAPNKIWFSLNLKSTKFFMKSVNYFLVNVHKEDMFRIEKEDGREAP